MRSLKCMVNLATVHRIAEHGCNGTWKPIGLPARGDSFCIQTEGNSPTTFSLEVLPIDPADHLALFGNDPSWEFDDLSVLDLESHRVTVCRWVHHVPLTESIFAALLQGAKAAPVINARR